MANQRDGGIAWTDETWNPLRGCSPKMPCAPRCWACKMAHRHEGNEHYQGFTTIGKHGVEWTGKVGLIEHELEAPLHWRKPRNIAVGLMGDLFRLPMSAIERIFRVMLSAPHHTYQLLTKQAAEMRECVPYVMNRIYGPHWRMPDFIHLGVSCMTQPDLDRDVPLLLQTPAAVRWLSLEPLLGPISFRWAKWHDYKHTQPGPDGRVHHGHLDGMRGIDWVVVGGESGPGARPMDEDWVRAIRDQCIAAGVPFLYKQRLECGKKISLPELDGKVWAQFPEAMEARER